MNAGFRMMRLPGMPGLTLAVTLAAPWLAPAAYGSEAVANAIGAGIGKHLAARPSSFVMHSVGVPPNLEKVKTIAVIRSFEPRTYPVIRLADYSDSPDALSQLIGAGNQGAPADAQEAFTRMVKQHSAVPISAQLADGIAAQLTRLGYAATVEEGPWEVVDGYATLDFDNIKSSADAVLVIKPTVIGFLAPGNGPYVPTVTAIITVLSAAEKQVLYRGFHDCGLMPKASGWRYCSSSSPFEHFDDMTSQPQKTADALAEAAAGIAASVAQDLKR